jgi:hypothetical protein
MVAGCGLVMVAQPVAAANTNYNLNAVGSYYGFCAINALKVKLPDGNKLYDTPNALNSNLECEVSPPQYTIPADAEHEAITYNANNPPPNGSSAGIAAFIADAGAGNIAFVRSTLGRTAANPANLEFWAYGMDAAVWVDFTSNKAAPTSLTPTQINDIYTCKFTNWKQVGGKNAPITRYYPQKGQGVAAPFANFFLGGTFPKSTKKCPITFVAADDATQVAPGDQATAILPYDYSDYVAQSRKVIPDLAKGTVMRGVDGTRPSAKTVQESAAKTNVTGNACTAPVVDVYCASSYIYNVTWQELPIAYYAAAIEFMGVPANGVAEPTSLCSNRYATTLSHYGIVTLPLAQTAQATSSDPVPGQSYCRQF